MKQLIFASLLAAVFGLPAIAQDTSTDSASAPAATQAEDPSVEIVFWESVKDSDNPELFLAYIKRYPDGVFTVIAEERLKEIYAAEAQGGMTEEPAVVDDGATASSDNGGTTTTIVVPGNSGGNVSGRDLYRRIQRNLKRLGCYYGAIDGIWGAGSIAAARRFNKATVGANIKRPRNPGLPALNLVKSYSGRVCF